MINLKKHPSKPELLVLADQSEILFGTSNLDTWLRFCQGGGPEFESWLKEKNIEGIQVQTHEGMFYILIKFLSLDDLRNYLSGGTIKEMTVEEYQNQTGVNPIRFFRF